MAIDNQYNGEVVEWGTNFQKREIAVSDQPNPTVMGKTLRKATYPLTHREVTQDVSSLVWQVEKDLTEPANQLCKCVVDLMSTEADFERQLNAQYIGPPVATYILHSMRKHCTDLTQLQSAWNW